MAKIYTTDGKIIADDFPQIQIGDKLYRVDTRKSTYDKIQKEVTKEGADEDRIILENCLGKEAYKEVEAMNLTLKSFMNLLIYVQAAMFDLTFEEAEARFQKASNR